MTQQLKVWWIPQIPGKFFEVPVSSVDACNSSAAS